MRRRASDGLTVGIFTQIGSLLADGVGRVGAAVAGLWSALANLADSDVRRQAAFAVSMIALSAKMAKADGVVTRVEVDAFTRIFTIAPDDARHVGRIYNLAKQDTAGFESYAQNVSRLFADDPAILEDILDGRFEIAKADGAVHERELAYLERVGGLFGFDTAALARIYARHVVGDTTDPYLVLGADPSWTRDALRRRYRSLVAETHPDRLIARGVPEEFIRIATDRLAAINGAWDAIETMRRP